MTERSMTDKELAPEIPGVDGQIVLAAKELTEAQKKQPAWLWFNNEGSSPNLSLGRWQKEPQQAPYVRLDLALIAIAAGSHRSNELVAHFAAKYALTLTYRTPLPGAAAAFRAGLEAAALWHDAERRYLREPTTHATVRNKLLAEMHKLLAEMHEYSANDIREIPTPPEYAAPERKWTRAEDWRGEPNTTVALWVYRPSFRRSVFMLHIDVDEDGTLMWHREGALVTPVLPGDLPEPPKDVGE